MEAFANAYEAELAHFAPLCSGREVSSVFFGGGTPSLMPPSLVARLIERIAALFHLRSDAEITLEANPTSVEMSRLAEFSAAGVGRFSLGIQSFDDAQLRFLGREHSADQARRAIDAARSVTGAVSADFIYALSGQTCAQWSRAMDDIIALNLPHLSLYQLTIERGTQFHRLHHHGKLEVIGDDEAADMYIQTREVLRGGGYELYEISNAARPGSECVHNMHYWRYLPYIGVGPGAHGRLHTDGQVHAVMMEHSPHKWHQRVKEAGHGAQQWRTLSATELREEYIMMGLRTREGIDLLRLEEMTGKMGINAQSLARLKEGGFIREIRDGSEHRITCTDEGQLLLSSITAELL